MNMYWNAAHYHELPSETKQVLLAEPLSTLPLIQHGSICTGDDDQSNSHQDSGAAIPSGVIRAIESAGMGRRRQREFWEGILYREELQSYRVVCGGRRARFMDQVRGGIHPKGMDALIELVVPPVLQIISNSLLEKVANIVEAFRYGGGDRIINIGTLVKKFATAGSRPHIRFMQILRFGDPRLLLPLGGHISNALVEKQLRETQLSREFRVVAASSDNAEPRELTTLEQVAALRAEKKRLIQSRGSLDESIVLDDKIRYELWSKMGPVAQPHLESSTNGCATDSVYILFTRVPSHSTSSEAVLSVQSLHVLGLAAMPLFHSPWQMLGDQADTFRRAALLAVKEKNSIGFEAILKVQRRQPSGMPETPRNFAGSPSLSTVKVSIHAAPSPLML